MKEKLKKKLNKLAREGSKKGNVENDPIEFLLRDYETQQDYEIIGLVASCLAYGQVKVFKRKIGDLTNFLGSSPHEEITSNFKRLQSNLIEYEFSYRMTDHKDMIDLFSGIKEALEKYNTLERLYVEAEGRNHLEKLGNFVNEIRKGREREDLERGFQFLLPNPMDGSACKRLNLFLRWMVRDDNVDLGLWDTPDTHQLIIPLDAHIYKISRELGFTDRKTKNIKTAKEVTESLKEFDQNDPLKYDFALCHLGMDNEEGKLETFKNSD